MRMRGTLEKFPNIREWQLEQIQHLCVFASDHANYTLIRDDTFLIIAISLKDSQSLFRNRSDRDELRRRIIDVGTDGSEPQITIRWNVLPRHGYWRKLQNVHRRSHWTKKFYPYQVIEESLRERISLTEKLKERRRTGAQCELARFLQIPDDRDAVRQLVDLRIVDLKELVTVKRIGIGSEGTVWRVVWENCTFAKKSFKMENAFANELTFTSDIEMLHPNIVRTLGRSPVPPDQGRPEKFLLMELLDGDLQRCMYESERTKLNSTRLSFSWVDRLDVLLQIATAMQILHDKEVVHGDLKLGNILVSEFEVSGNARHFHAKVSDFGQAKIIPNGGTFLPNGGTTTYAAPEVLRSRPDNRAGLPNPKKLDVYSFGVVAYEVLTGHWAYGGKLDPRERHQVMTGSKRLIHSREWRNLKGGFGYSCGVVPLVERCLEYLPEDRPSFSTICCELTKSKLSLQDVEKKVAAYLKYFVSLSAIVVVVFIFLRFAPRV